METKYQCFRNMFFTLSTLILFLFISCNNNNQLIEPEEKLTFTFGVSNGYDAVIGCTLEVIAPTYINNKVVTTRWFINGVRNYFLDGQRYYSPTSIGDFYVIVTAQGFEEQISNVITITESDWNLFLKDTKWRKTDNNSVWIEFEGSKMYWNYAAQGVYFGETLNSRWGNNWGNTIKTKTNISFTAIVENDILIVSDWSGSFYGESEMNGNYYKE